MRMRGGGWVGARVKREKVVEPARLQPEPQHLGALGGRSRLQVAHHAARALGGGQVAPQLPRLVHAVDMQHP